MKFLSILIHVPLYIYANCFLLLEIYNIFIRPVYRLPELSMAHMLALSVISLMFKSYTDTTVKMSTGESIALAWLKFIVAFGIVQFAELYV